jgi:ribonuclease P protein component
MTELPRAAVDERLPRTARLRLRPEFERCYREGRRLHAGGFTLHWLPGPAECSRVGVTASRKVGDSVTRHRLKRWAREVFRRSSTRPALADCDLVVHFKPGAAPADFMAFRDDFERLLIEIGRRRIRR